ncbi:hypothetical protein V6O07_00415 [Arthrospira platensis SPKY2]
MILTRYEIHTKDYVRGAVLSGVYSQQAWEEVCLEAGVDPDEAEEFSDEYELKYPALPEGDYSFWFTPEGDISFRKYHGHLIARAMALSKKGELVILHREYNRENLIYEDKDQVVYLR